MKKKNNKINARDKNCLSCYFRFFKHFFIILKSINIAAGGKIYSRPLFR